ncbi:TauD/TfdA family dioxygenase [Streptomyces sp. NPDC004126]|uniref:TauD/TfdA family dioxygenase n=1 Tax=Streptomyces sp. NPDC004126 TaxID=3390695 RepID=UPI003D061979
MGIPRPFDSVRYTVGRELVLDLLDEAPDRPPVAERPGYQQFTKELRAHADRHLDGTPGYFLLSGLDHLTEDQARRFAPLASAALGDLLPQDGRGTLLREVRDRGVELGEGLTGRYSDTRHGGNLHTDSPHRPGTVPDCFALYCVHQAASGGSLVLVDLRDLTARLGDRPDLLKSLEQPVHFDCRDDTPGAPRTVVRPVLQDTGGGTYRAHYLREYIEIGHGHESVTPLTAEQVEAFDALDALLADPALQQTDRLREHEMIFIDNRAVLHGRTPFTDGPVEAAKRLMLRTWITFR